ncbi:MAG: aminotransferase class I/II-fold pyridoxal phosphate-dependent enzyme [Clostridia bacterium]|nr:aminotransferase class I/II-fold pyridoxal phosphate-dependent enzyme [Clostridia bacterium]
MNYIARRFQNLSAGLSLNADAVKSIPDLIDLSIGDTDFITDGRIIDAAMRDAHAGYTRYGFPQGDPQLIDAVIQAWQEDFHQTLSPDEILITASSCLGMALVCMAILNPGDEVIVPSPYFSVYRQQIELAGGVCVELPTCQENGWQIPESDLRAAVSRKTKAIILNTPNNPTGCAYSLDTLKKVADIATAHDLLLIADEIYTRYLFDGVFTPLRTLPDIKERVITLNSFSKNFMMTGWRVGVLIAPPAIRQVVQTINGAMIYTAPSVSQRAAIEALRHRDELAQTVIGEYRRRMFETEALCHDIPYMTLCRPQGTFYLFPDISSSGLSSAAFCEKALKEAHVLVSPGHLFGSGGEGHIRLALTRPMEEIKEALRRLSQLSLS